MSDKCEYVVGGFTKKDVPINISKMSLPERIAKLFPNVGQVLAIKDNLNTTKDKGVYEYLSFVQKDFNLFNENSVLSNEYDKELVDSLEQLESNNTITINSMNNIRNFDDIVKLKFISELHRQLVKYSSLPEMNINYFGKNVICKNNVLYIDGVVTNIKDFTSVLEKDSDSIGSKIKLNSVNLIDYYLNGEETSAYYREVCTLLLEHIDKVANTPVYMKSSILKTDNASGYYNLVTNTIELYMIDKAVFLHELIHAFTLGVVFNKNDNFLLSPAEESYIKDINNLYNIAVEYNKNNNGDKYYYGLTSVQEFISEGFSNTSFQNLLRKIPTKNEGENAFTKFVNIIKALFERYSYDTDNTVLNDLINKTMNYIVNEEIVDNAVWQLHRDYNRIQRNNIEIFKLSEMLNSNPTITIENNSFVITDNSTYSKYIIDTNSDNWYNMNILYKDNYETVYSNMLEDYINSLKRENSKLRDFIYKTVYKKDKAKAMEHVLEKLKEFDKDYYDRLREQELAERDYTDQYLTKNYEDIYGVEETDNLSIDYNEGTKISYCK